MRRHRLYIVTGISRLTGQRESITIPCFRWTAQSICEREMQKPARKRDYLRLRVEILPEGNGLYDQINKAMED